MSQKVILITYRNIFNLFKAIILNKLSLVVYKLDDGTESIECRKYIGEGFPYHPQFSLGDQVSVKGFINVLNGYSRLLLLSPSFYN